MTVRVAVAGVAGRMGSRIAALVVESGEFELVGATESPSHEVQGKDVGELLGLGRLDVVVTDDMERAAADADGIIDFTTPEVTMANVACARRSGKAMVIGTTGFDEEQTALLRRSTESFACVLAPNMSVGVNVMFDIVRRTAGLLGEGYDVEIVELHHRYKEDAPSGTALKLAESVGGADRGRGAAEVLVFARHGRSERREGEIGLQSLRGGDVVGEHTVFFLGDGERIEITHRATSRDIFARGALRAMGWVVGRPPGLYTMRDVLGI